jgi:hypothetical protein
MSTSTPTDKPNSIHLQYGPTFEIDPMDGSTHDDQYGKVWLLGFQDDPDVQRVNLLADDWEKNPAAALGKYPVFTRGEAGLYNWELKVTVVRFNGQRYVQ